MGDQNSHVLGSPAELGVMGQLLYGFIATQAVAVTAKMGLADLVEKAPMTAEELATTTKAHTPSLERLLRALTSIGVFAEGEDGKFQQTALSSLLRVDHPQSARALAIMIGSSFIWRPWGELERAVMTGKSAFESTFGATVFNYLPDHSDVAETVNDGMTSASALDAAAVVAAYDFSRFERIVDVGGGHGGLLHTILSASPRPRGMLADQPAVVAGATVLRTGTMADRCEIAGVDFFKQVPEGGDAYIMKWVLHDWSDADALKILRTCRRAIQPDGTLLIVDAVLKASNVPDPRKLMDLNMLVMAPGGREWTEAEFRALLGDAGFSLTRVIPTAGPLSIVESRPV
jgi:O-methyltransferase domain/Dimerisation domain